MGLRYEHALSTYNHGRALQDCGRIPAALRLYERARRLAADDDYGDILVLSLNALGAGAFETRQYGKMESVARDLLAVATRTNNREYELSARHMLAVSSLIRRRKPQSAAKFRAAINKARAYDAHEWVTRCLIDSTRERAHPAGDRPKKAVRPLCLLKTPNACDSQALENLEGFFSWSAGGSGDSTDTPLNPNRLERADYPLYSQTPETPGRRSDR